MSNKHSPLFTYSFMTVCVLIFFGVANLPASLIQSIIEKFALRPSGFTASKYFSLITYMLLHVNLSHLASNMFVLLNIGRAVETEIGSINFGLAFLCSGALSGFLHVFFNQSSQTNVIGASGAIFGSIGMLLLLMPFTFTNVLLLPLPGVILGLFQHITG